MVSKNAERAAWALIVAGAAWPSALGALHSLAMSPLEQALHTSWCGAAPHVALDILGHCPACWTGATALALAGASFLISRRHGYWLGSTGARPLNPEPAAPPRRADA